MRKHPKVLAIISGKGGSVKTSLTVEIAKLFASKKNLKVALIDLDIKGPNMISRLTNGHIPKMEIVNNWIKAYRVSGFPYLSAFSTEIYADSDSGIALHSDDIKRFLQSIFVITDWGFEPDLYICDTDPAASDTLDVLKKLFGKQVYGVLVSTPDTLSIDNTIRSIDVCKDKKVKLIGYVGNMVYFRCPVCHTKHMIFGDSRALNVFHDKYNLPTLGMIEFSKDFSDSESIVDAFRRIDRELYGWGV